MDKISISFDLASSNYEVPLTFQVMLGLDVLRTIDHVSAPHAISLEIDDTDGEHEIKFFMKNKTQEHTVIDADGNIISDAMLTIANMTFDDIKLGHLFTEQAVYHHDFNGTQTPIEDEFFGDMGCNGHVSLKFTTPIYLWLLENM